MFNVLIKIPIRIGNYKLIVFYTLTIYFKIEFKAYIYQNSIYYESCSYRHQTLYRIKVYILIYNNITINYLYTYIPKMIFTSSCFIVFHNQKIFVFKETNYP